MKKNIISCLLLFTCYLSTFAQCENELIIRDFFKAIYTDSIAADDLVSRHIVYDGIGHDEAINTILAFRDIENTSLGDFKALKKSVVSGQFKIIAYEDFQPNEKKMFNHNRGSIYKLQTGDNKIPPRYIWVDNGKILSFFGFKKGSDDEYMFLVYTH